MNILKNIIKLTLGFIAFCAVYIAMALSFGVKKDNLVCNVTSPALVTKKAYLTLERWSWWARPFRWDKPVQIDLNGDIFGFYIGNYSLDNLVDAKTVFGNSGKVLLDLRSGEVLITDASLTYRGECRKNESSLI